MNNVQTPEISERFYKRLIWIFSILIFLVILILSRLPRSAEIPEWVPFLPSLNAFLNGSTFIILLFSFYFIRKGRISIHRRLNLLASTLSVLFLISYVTFHSFGVETKFPVENPLRPVYLIILSTHIILAAVVMPLVLLSLFRGLTMQIERHRKITRWSFPIWLYVTLSGVVVYLMISPYYKF
jgi:putative membrane protein